MSRRTSDKLIVALQQVLGSFNQIEFPAPAAQRIEEVKKQIMLAISELLEAQGTQDAENNPASR